MTSNPILEELHAARRKLLAECGNDLSAYLRDAEVRLEESGRPIAQVSQRKVQNRDVLHASAASDSTHAT